MLRELIPASILLALRAQGIDPSAIDAYEVDATADPVAVRVRLKPSVDVIQIEIVKD